MTGALSEGGMTGALNEGGVTEALNKEGGTGALNKGAEALANRSGRFSRTLASKPRSAELAC